MYTVALFKYIFYFFAIYNFFRILFKRISDYSLSLFSKIITLQKIKFMSKYYMIVLIIKVQCGKYCGLWSDGVSKILSLDIHWENDYIQVTNNNKISSF